MSKIPKRFNLRRCARDVIESTDWQATTYEEQSPVPDVDLLILQLAVQLDDGGTDPVFVQELRDVIAQVPKDWGMDYSDVESALDIYFGEEVKE